MFEKINKLNKKISTFLLAMIILLSAITFLGIAPKPVAAEVEIGETETGVWSSHEQVTGIVGDAKMNLVDWNEGDEMVWTTLWVQNTGGANMAEVNVVATHDWMGWHYYCCFTWEDNSGGKQSTHTNWFYGVGWSDTIGLCVGKTNDHTWTGYYKINNGQWQTIGSHYYTYAWNGVNPHSGLEMLQPATYGQVGAIISTMNNVQWQYNGGPWYTPTFSNTYVGGEYSNEEYNIGVNSGGYGSWSSQVRGWAIVYANAYHPEYGTLYPYFYMNNDYYGTQPCGISASTGWWTFQTDEYDPLYSLPAVRVYYNGNYVADGYDSGSQYVPEIGAVDIEFVYGNSW